MAFLILLLDPEMLNLEIIFRRISRVMVAVINVIPLDLMPTRFVRSAFFLLVLLLDSALDTSISSQLILAIKSADMVVSG